MKIKVIRPFLQHGIASAGTCICFLGTCHLQAQTGATIPSNLDQTAGVTSKGGIRPQGAGTPGPIALPEGFSELLLGPGFGLEMTVFNAPEMNGALRVDALGNVVVPLIGSIQVSNFTLPKAERAIEKSLLENQILVHPSVKLQITTYPQRPVVVAGEVQQPGKIQILRPQPVLDLIASAGGVTTAAGGEIEVRHPQMGKADEITTIKYANGQEPKEARATLVEPGDTIFVRRAGVIYVLGAVNHPGGYLMVNGGTLTLSQALALASGTSPIASTSNVVVVRKAGATIEKKNLPLRAEDRGDKEPFPLQDGDMVYVPTSKVKSALINSSVVLSSAASATIYAAAGR